VFAPVLWGSGPQGLHVLCYMLTNYSPVLVNSQILDASLRNHPLTCGLTDVTILLSLLMEVPTLPSHQTLDWMVSFWI
jgi:hypothetical protein